MIPLAAMTSGRPTGSPWVASLYAGVITAIFAVVTVYFFEAEQPALYIPAFFLTGAGPVIGYGLANGRLGSSIGGIIGGIIGSIPVLGFILWPILVGALTRSQSIGRLLIGSIIGVILGWAIFFGVATTMGQDPYGWFGLGVVLLLAVWGGACGAVMTAWAKS